MTKTIKQESNLTELQHSTGQCLTLDLHQHRFPETFLETVEYNVLKIDDIPSYPWSKMYLSVVINPSTQLPTLILTENKLPLGERELFIPLPIGTYHTFYFEPNNNIWYDEDVATAKCKKWYYTVDVDISTSDNKEYPYIGTRITKIEK